VFFRVNGHFPTKTNGSGTKKFIFSQKPTVLAQKSSFPFKNQRFWHKKVHFLSKTDGSWTKKSISPQKPTVLAQKSPFPLKNRRFSREKGVKRWGGVRFEKEGNTFSKKYRISQYREKFKSKKRWKSGFFLFSYYKKWNLGI